MAYGARLESVLGRKSLEGSNPSLSANFVRETLFTYSYLRGSMFENCENSNTDRSAKRLNNLCPDVRALNRFQDIASDHAIEHHDGQSMFHRQAEGGFVHDLDRSI